jgi:hypothetical protein
VLGWQLLKGGTAAKFDLAPMARLLLLRCKQVVANHNGCAWCAGRLLQKPVERRNSRSYSSSSTAHLNLFHMMQSIQPDFDTCHFCQCC